MNFYDNVHEMVKKLKETEEYTNYVSMKEKIKQDANVYAKIKEFKDKQREQQLRYIEGTKPTEAEQQHMQNLYSIIIQNADAAKFFESEIRLNILLADIQKILTDGIKDVLEF